MGSILAKVEFYTFQVFVGSGLVHLVENTGDPWKEEADYQELQYFECVYFLIVTMSTVGYGDISCQTNLGRILTVLLLMVLITVFSLYVPELARLMMSQPK